jgi:predicted DNA-binding transcriptional regulator AlpA
MEDDLTNETPPTPRLDRLLTLEEVAERLRKTPAAMRWQIHIGAAPKSALLGGRRVWRSSDVEAFIEDAFNREEVGA